MRTRTSILILVMLTGFAPRVESQAPADRASEGTRQMVTGPSGPINDAIAGGATAIVSLQPVPPKTVPASSYPMGSSIVGQTLTLGSVPARVWIESHLTNWAPEDLRVGQIYVDALDIDSDGGGYLGSNAECNGVPVTGAGDLAPAMQACGGVCSNNPGQSCVSNAECSPGTCQNAHAACRANISGLSSACGLGEPSRCLNWDGVSPGAYFPPGRWCEHGFHNKCDPQHITSGIAAVAAFDLSTLNPRFGFAADPGEVVPDFHPSKAATFVIDVPADAKGSYTLDVDGSQTFMQDFDQNNIPVAALNVAVIRVPICSTHMDCNDNDICTIDSCPAGCCQHDPVAGWNPDTECCHPMSGVQAPIPASTPCRVGGCDLGGSSGSPTFTDLGDGASCTPQDRCYLPGQCVGGVCDAEEYAGPDCLKSRFISYEPFTGSAPSAYRVRMVSLHHPDPPYRAGVAADFSAFEGQYRWVGPASTYVESSVNTTPVYAAVLGCDPHYADWSPFDLLHVTGSEVVPSSVYQVQSIAEGLDVGNEANYSAPMVLQTDAWGDAVWPYSPPSTTIQPNATDHALVIDKFRSVSGAMSKPRALMVGPDASDIPNLTFDVDFSQVSANIDAFKGLAYPFAGPAPCP